VEHLVIRFNNFNKKILNGDLTLNKLKRLLSTQFLFFYFILPIILINLIIIIPYVSYSHNRIISYQRIQEITPQEILLFENPLPIQLEFLENSALFDQYYIANISFGFIYQTVVKINNTDLDIFLTCLKDDFFFGNMLWNKKENLDAIVSSTLAENISIIPSVKQKEIINLIGNNCSFDFNSILVMKEEAIFGKDILRALRDNLKVYETEQREELPLLIIPFSIYEQLNLTQNPFEIDNNYVLHFIYYNYNETIFDEHNSFNIFSELMKLRFQIKNYLNNAFNISLKDNTFYYSNFYTNLKLNSGFSFLSDLFVPTLIFLHGFLIGLIVMVYFIDKMLRKVNLYLLLLFERGGTKTQAVKSITIILALTNIVAYCLTIIVSYLIINIAILGDFSAKIGFKSVFFITTISSIVVLAISMRRILKYIINFNVERKIKKTNEDNQRKGKIFLLVFMVTILDVISLSIISLGIINDFETYILPNLIFSLSLLFILFLVWFSFFSNTLYKLYKIIIKRMITNKPIKQIFKKLLDSIPLKSVRILRVFMLLFFITISTFQINDSLHTRQSKEVKFNTIGDLNMRLDIKDLSTYTKNLRNLVEEDVIFFEMEAQIDIYCQKKSIVYIYNFPIFLFSSENFSSYLAYSKIDRKTINFDESETNTQFFLSKKFIKLSNAKENEIFIFQQQGQTQFFQTKGFVGTLPVLSLISHMESAREIRDAFGILIYKNHDSKKFKNYINYVIAASIFDSDSSKELYLKRTEYFNSLGFNFEFLDSATMKTDILIKSPTVQGSSFFYPETFSTYGFVELLILMINCFYLLGGSIYPFYQTIFTSSSVLISRGFNSKKSINFGFFISTFLILFYFFISYVFSTALVGLYCVFLSTDNYIRFIPTLSFSSIVIIFILLFIIFTILLISRLIFKYRMKKDLLSLLKKTKNIFRAGDEHHAFSENLS